MSLSSQGFLIEPLALKKHEKTAREVKVPDLGTRLLEEQADGTEIASGIDSDDGNSIVTLKLISYSKTRRRYPNHDNGGPLQKISREFPKLVGVKYQTTPP